ncbi:hypothetical protein L6452_40744 [Arctium lappa]|uniref:Uncharacterized protein n=1 Tax=Arctium lappa TaxID=4217 RepID=A0ACB8XN56_ARCLA|nr:hypothetical protein L6452_40744 [Arctium lappa]
MNPDYETDDTEEYFNKEHGEHKKPKYSGVSRKNTSSLRKRAEFSNDVGGRSWKKEQPEPKATGRINMAKDSHGSSSLVRPKNPVECNGLTISNRNHQTTGSSQLLNPASETATSSYSMRNTPALTDSEMDKVWHYRDPSGKVQGPFCMIQLQKWSTTGYFPVDMRIWTNREDESLLLNDVLKEQSQNARLSENKTTADKVGIRIEGLTVRTTNLLSTEKLSDNNGSLGQSSVQNSTTNGNILNGNPSSFAKSNDSTGQFNTLELASPTPVENNADIKRVSSIFDISDASLVDLPSPTPKKTISHEEEKVQNGGDKEQPIMPSSEILVQDARNFTLNQDVGGAQLPKAADEWSGYSPTQVKREEWSSGGVSVSALQGEGDHVATTTSNIEQIIHSSSPPSLQPAYSYMPPWNGVRETIEFSTLAEESVSDLLAEVDAMESQNGFPSPTSRRNSFVEDLFNGSFEEFSPTPDQGARSDGFSSRRPDIQLPYQTAAAATTTTTTVASTAATDEHSEVTSQGNNGNVFDFVKNSPGLQPSFICPETKSENTPFKWPEMPPETVSKDIQAGCHSSEFQPPLHNVNNSAKDHKERESGQPINTKPKDASPEFVPQLSQRTEPEDRTDHTRSGGGMAVGGRKAGDGGGAENEQDGSFIHIAAAGPPPLRPLPPSLDKVYPQRVGSEAMQGNMNNFGRPYQEMTTRGGNPHLNAGRGVNIGWDPHQRLYDGERHNNNSPRERSYKGRQLSFGGVGGGGYSRPLPPKGQRVCKFYESGRCKKGASCNYWHPLP